MTRKIIHIDCDCFYAAVEMRDNPNLRYRPIAVGGEPGKRGVISTCNYPAREFGVHSAMASAYAKRLCPELIILPHRLHYYKEVSQQIHRIFLQYTEQIEPLSLDEAFLDVSSQTHFQGSATRMAEAIRKQVKSQIGITVSAGVAPNKFVAKIASDWNKPDGICVVTPQQLDQFVKVLPIEKLHGVGKVTSARLHSLGIRTCDDIRQYGRFEFIERMGSFGEYLYNLAQGLDERPVQPRANRKSLSVEHTYAMDLPDLNSCQAKFPELCQQLTHRLAKVKQRHQIKKLFVKLKFSDFTSTTMECGAREPSLDIYQTLCDQAFQRKNMPVRLLGVGVRFWQAENSPQSQIAFDFG